MPAQAPQLSLAEKKEIVREHLYGWVDKGAEYARDRSRKLYGGALGFILNPAAETLINALALPKMKKSAKQALDVVLDCACEGTGQKTLDKWLEKFLDHNDVYARVNKRHKKHHAVLLLIKKSFAWQVEGAAMLLASKGNNYAELVRSAYPTKVDPDKLLVREYKCAEAVIRIDEKYPGLIKIPRPIRKEARIITRSTLTMVRDGMREELNEFYPESAWEQLVHPAAQRPRASAK